MIIIIITTTVFVTCLLKGSIRTDPFAPNSRLLKKSTFQLVNTSPWAEESPARPSSRSSSSCSCSSGGEVRAKWGPGPASLPCLRQLHWLRGGREVWRSVLIFWLGPPPHQPALPFPRPASGAAGGKPLARGRCAPNLLRHAFVCSPAADCVLLWVQLWAKHEERGCLPGELRVGQTQTLTSHVAPDRWLFLCRHQFPHP